jgi:MFS family permease
MDRYKDNAKWLMFFAPFKALSVSAAYLTPFFLEKGLSLSEVFLLQSIFSAAFLVLELPSGYFADRFGRAFSIKMSVPIAAVAMLAYGASTEFWQFVVWELVLAVANSLISGVDKALLIDSLKASGRDKEYVKLSQCINALGYAATGMTVPLAITLVHFFGISSTLIADGVLTLIGAIFAFKLVEAPRYSGSQEEIRLSAFKASKQLLRNVEARWLIALATVLSTATYLAFWLSTPYYQSLGIPIVLFSVILAVRSLWKAWLSHYFTADRHLERNMIGYALLAGLVYVAMATDQIWLLWVVLGHDIIQALHSEPITDRLNLHEQPG